MKFVQDKGLSDKECLQINLDEVDRRQICCPRKEGVVGILEHPSLMKIGKNLKVLLNNRRIIIKEVADKTAYEIETKSQWSRRKFF